MFKQLLLALSLSLIFSHCKNSKETTQAKTPEVKESQKVEEETEVETANLVGKTYRGLLPCKDCMGIETELTFKADGQYEVKSFYLGKSEEVRVTAGNYQLDGNQIICRINNQIVSRYLLEEDQLVPEGSQASSKGRAAELYILRNKLSQIIDRYWQLTEVLGQKVEPTENKRKPYLLIRHDQSFSASGGCNSMFGRFEFVNKHFIQFSEIGSSEMACTFNHYDQALIEALERSRQFTINKNGELVLIVGKAAPLARFKKVGL